MTTNATLNQDGQPVRPFRLNLLNNERKTVDEIVGFCRGVLADGIVNDAEAAAFRDWVIKTGGRRPGWPLDEIQRRIERIFSDAAISNDEREELADIMRQLSGLSDVAPMDGATTLPIDDPAPEVDFHSEFCVTGKFAFGTRQKVFAEIERRGGVPNDVPRESTRFLIIGVFASRDWVHASYGRKIERAVELRAKQTGIKIIGEDHWRSALIAFP